MCWTILIIYLPFASNPIPVVLLAGNPSKLLEAQGDPLVQYLIIPESDPQPNTVDSWWETMGNWTRMMNVKLLIDYESNCFHFTIQKILRRQKLSTPPGKSAYSYPPYPPPSLLPSPPPSDCSGNPSGLCPRSTLGVFSTPQRPSIFTSPGIFERKEF